MIDRFGPGVGHSNYLAVPGVGIFEFLFVPVTTNHFPGRIFDLTFLPGGREFDSNVLENVKIPPYDPPPPHAGLTLIGALHGEKLSRLAESPGEVDRVPRVGGNPSCMVTIQCIFQTYKELASPG